MTLGAGREATSNGVAPVEAIDQKIAALLGSDAKEITVADMAVHPRRRTPTSR